MLMAGFQVTTKDDIAPYAEYFDRRITIQYQVPVSDGQGGQTAPATTDWQTLAITWAHLEPWKGRTAFEAEQFFGHSFLRALIRYRPSLNVNQNMRFLYRSKIYLIRWVGVPVEASKVVEMLAEELQPVGSVG